MAAWNEAKLNRRIHLLKVGSLLRAFIARRLAEGVGLCEADRLRIGATRAAATKAAADSLKISRERVNELIRTSAAVELLCLDGVLGKLAYGSLRHFRACIQRPVRKVRRNKGGCKADEVEIVETEAWEIRPECMEWAASVFRRAVTEDWGERKVVKELAARIPKSNAGRRPKAASTDGDSGNPGTPKRSGGYTPILLHQDKNNSRGDKDTVILRMAQKAAPQDLVDLILQLIKGSQQPESVRDRLVGELLKPMPKSPNGHPTRSPFAQSPVMSCK